MKLINKNNIISFVILMAVYGLGQLMITTGAIDSYILLNIVLIGINIILAVSLNLITGYTGSRIVAMSFCEPRSW